jgi:hypothetical protein
MVIRQRQSLKVHHGEIQGKKHDAKDNKRTHERQKVIFHVVTPLRTTQKKRSKQPEPTQKKPAPPKDISLFHILQYCIHQRS